MIDDFKPCEETDYFWLRNIIQFFKEINWNINDNNNNYDGNENDNDDYNVIMKTILLTQLAFENRDNYNEDYFYYNYSYSHTHAVNND